MCFSHMKQKDFKSIDNTKINNIKPMKTKETTVNNKSKQMEKNND